MKNFKLLLLLSLLSFIFIITACNQSKASSTNPPVHPIQNSQNSHLVSDYPYKDIKIERFISAVLEGGTLVPGEGSVWNIDKKIFIKEMYGSELLNSESDLFQEHRNTTMPDGNSSVQPPLHITFEDIDILSKVYPVYLFDSTEKLYCINYRYNYNVSQQDQYKIVVNKIFDLVSLEKNTLVLKKENEIPDMNTFDFTKDKFMLMWFTVEQNQFFRLTSVAFQGHLFLDLTISNKSSLN